MRAAALREPCRRSGTRASEGRGRHPRCTARPPGSARRRDPGDVRMTRQRPWEKCTPGPGGARCGLRGSPRTAASRESDGHGGRSQAAPARSATWRGCRAGGPVFGARSAWASRFAAAWTPPPRPELAQTSDLPPKRLALGRAGQSVVLEQLAESLGFEQAPSRAARQFELRKDLVRQRVALAVLAVLALQPFAQVLVTHGGVEYALDDELRCHRPVPMVRLQAEDDVVAAWSPEPVEVTAHPERDRAPAVDPGLRAHAEAKVLSVPDGRGIRHLTRRREQRYVGVPQAERRQPRELLTEL